MEYPPGFEAPVFRSLFEPVLLAGAPRDFAIFLWLTTLVVCLAVGFRGMWFVLAAAAVLHVVAAAAAKHDPHFLQVLSKALRAPRNLDP